MTTFDLRKLRLRSGDQARERVEIELEPLVLGGQAYQPQPNAALAELTVTRASSGTVLELALDVSLEGPCFRCLTDAELPLSLRLREYEATKPEGDEEQTEYLEDDRLDLSAWTDDEARDHAVKGGAVVEALARQVQEVLHVAGGLVGQELQLHLPELRFDDRTRGRGFGQRRFAAKALALSGELRALGNGRAVQASAAELRQRDPSEEPGELDAVLEVDPAP